MLFFLFWGSVAAKVIHKLIPKKKNKKIKKNLLDFVRTEEGEIEEFLKGKESFSKFYHDSGSIVKEYFLPSKHNAYRPKILRVHSLVSIVAFVLVLKFLLVGFLFIAYPNIGKMSSNIETDILNLTNQDRQKENLPKLTMNSILSESALSKANDMLNKDYFAHYSPDGTTPWDWVDRDDYSYIFIGENLGMNFTTAESVHRALMNSPTHRHNIMSAKYQDMGVAVVNGEFKGKTTNILVELFGTAKTPQVIIAAKDAETVAPTAEVVKSEELKEPDKFVKQEIADLKVKKPITVDEPSVALSPKIPEPIKSTAKTAVLGQELDLAQKETEPRPALATINHRELPADGQKLEINPKLATTIDPGLEMAEQLKSKPIQIKNSDKNLTLISSVTRIFHIIMISLLALLSLGLLVNIIVRFRIQHKPLIVQSVIALVFILSILLINFHYLEAGNIFITLL